MELPRASLRPRGASHHMRFPPPRRSRCPSATSHDPHSIQISTRRGTIRELLRASAAAHRLALRATWPISAAISTAFALAASAAHARALASAVAALAAAACAFASASAAAASARRLGPGGCFPRSRWVGREGWRPGRKSPRELRRDLRRSACARPRSRWRAAEPPPCEHCPRASPSCEALFIRPVGGGRGRWGADAHRHHGSHRHHGDECNRDSHRHHGDESNQMRKLRRLEPQRLGNERAFATDFQGI